jgi:hypothetical protein
VNAKNGNSTIELPAAETLRAIAKVGVGVSSSNSICKYLERHDEVHQALEPVAAALRRTFGEGVTISLEFFSSKDGNDEYPVFMVRPAVYRKDLMARIREFLEENDRLFQFSLGWLGVTTDFGAAKHGV